MYAARFQKTVATSLEVAQPEASTFFTFTYNNFKSRRIKKIERKYQYHLGIKNALLKSNNINFDNKELIFLYLDFLS